MEKILTWTVYAINAISIVGIATAMTFMSLVGLFCSDSPRATGFGILGCMAFFATRPAFYTFPFVVISFALLHIRWRWAALAAACVPALELIYLRPLLM